MKRQPQHNQLAGYMNQLGIEVVGIHFGMIQGARVDPLPEHDQLCRKDDDQMKYQAPVYILEIDDAVIKLPDLGGYPSVQQYVETVVDIVNSTEEDVESDQ